MSRLDEIREREERVRKGLVDEFVSTRAYLAHYDIPWLLDLVERAREIISRADAWWKLVDKQEAEQWLSEVGDEMPNKVS